MLPSYGKITCRACFKGTESEVGEPHPDWRIVNDPGAWGADNPRILVLGFSKGATQAGIYQHGRFEEVAFAGMRPRLTAALRAMGVLSNIETVDEKIADRHSDIAFGSLIRCSVSRRDPKASASTGREVFACTGPLITKSFSEIPSVVRTCTEKYLVGLPATVHVVFLLGNSDGYVKSCQSLLQSLFPASFCKINAMAVKADGRYWIHLAHPSGLNGHFNDWLLSDVGAGQKREEAKRAVNALRLP